MVFPKKTIGLFNGRPKPAAFSLHPLKMLPGFCRGAFLLLWKTGSLVSVPGPDAWRYIHSSSHAVYSQIRYRYSPVHFYPSGRYALRQFRVFDMCCSSWSYSSWFVFQDYYITVPGALKTFLLFLLQYPILTIGFCTILWYYFRKYKN